LILKYRICYSLSQHWSIRSTIITSCQSYGLINLIRIAYVYIITVILSLGNGHHQIIW